jgi:signal transduction histidine kinase
MKEVNIEDMKVVKEFANVPDEQIQWLIDQGETLYLEQGDILFNIGDPVVNSCIILDGRLRICGVQSGKQRELRILDPGQATGYLPYSRATVSPAFAEALKRSWIFKCAKAKLKAGFGNNYELIEAMVHMMVSRVRDFTSIQQQDEKMFALGKLSAGLAHELNNPAAAISRAAALLQKQIKQLPDLFKDVSGLHISEKKLIKFICSSLNKINTEPAKLNMMQKASLEDDITDWLYDNNIKAIDTEGLTERGFTVEDLNMIKGCASPAGITGCA